MDDLELAARQWQQYWDRLSGVETLDIEHSISCVPGVGNDRCLAEREED